MSEQAVTVTLNGSPKSVTTATLADLLADLQLEGKRLAVELNRQIIPRTQYAATALHEGDAIEIVHFVGGG